MRSLLAHADRTVAFPRTLPAHLGGAPHAEVQVLEGTAQLPYEVRPTMLIEVVEHTSPAVTSILADAGFDLLDGQADEPIRRATFLMVAMPRG